MKFLPILRVLAISLANTFMFISSAQAEIICQNIRTAKIKVQASSQCSAGSRLVFNLDLLRTDGLPGATGATGAQGITGSVGSTGTKGDTGERGAVGPSGAQGLTGDIGLQGAQGPTGAQGIAGAIGAQGPTGLSPVLSPANWTTISVTAEAWFDADSPCTYRLISGRGTEFPAIFYPSSIWQSNEQHQLGGPFINYITRFANFLFEGTPSVTTTAPLQFVVERWFYNGLITLAEWLEIRNAQMEGNARGSIEVKQYQQVSPGSSLSAEITIKVITPLKTYRRSFNFVDSGFEVQKQCAANK